MPLIQVNLMEQVSTPIQKKEIVSKLTAAVAPFEGANMRPVTWATIEEICSLEWSIGGSARTTARCQTLSQAKSKARHIGGRHEHHYNDTDNRRSEGTAKRNMDGRRL